VTETAIQRVLPWSGLIAGPLAWALSFQGNYLLIEWECAQGLKAVPLVALLLTLVALIASYASWRAWQPAAGEPERSHRFRHFIGAVSALVALLFAFVIVLQAFAGIIFSGCER
jgi:hypothetical protein